MGDPDDPAGHASATLGGAPAAVKPRDAAGDLEEVVEGLERNAPAGEVRGEAAPGEHEVGVLGCAPVRVAVADVHDLAPVGERRHRRALARLLAPLEPALVQE